MSIKRILVPLPGQTDYSGEIDMALSGAKALGAHIEALLITQPPPPRSSNIGYGRNSLAAEAVNIAAEEQEQRGRVARERFAAACMTHGVPLLAADEVPSVFPSACWHEVEGSYLAVAVSRAAAFDLVVAASANVMESLRALAEQALLRTRRPVLVSPSHPKIDFTDSALIAWDQSPECWHAVSAAIPFLRLAKSVQVVSVDRDAAARRSSQDEVRAYLRCHGIEATTRVIEPHSSSIGDSLLATAGEGEVSLMVMGAYSHSRLRELLFGGVTRYILQNAAARPVLLAH